MKRIVAVAALLVAFATPVRGYAENSTVLALYARALRFFNPQLDGDSASLLARATVESADAQGIDARLLVALIATESRWDPGAISPAGARGLAQIMPQTARGLGIDLDDPLQNIAGAARHLRALLDRFADRDPQTQYALALAAYNAGLAPVMRYGGVPPYPETRAYVARVMRLWQRLEGAR